MQERITKKQLTAEKKKQAERAKIERHENREANAQLKANTKKQLELEKTAKKVSKETDKLRKQLEQFQNNHQKKKGGGNISLITPSAPTTPRPLCDIPTHPPTDMTIAIQSRISKENIPIPTSPSQ